jgi:hypothetical protein
MKLIATTFMLWVVILGCNTTAKISKQTLTQIPSSLVGNFTDDYGSNYTITDKVWMHGKKAKYHLLQYNKAENYFIAKNDDANPTDAGLYTRIDIMYFENMAPWQWGFCFTAYKVATIQEAINTVAADRINPRKGCNGYPFSRMKRE